MIINIQEYNNLFKKAYEEQTKQKIVSLHRFSHGYCFYYAYVLKKVFGNKIKVYSYLDKQSFSGHCFIKIGKLYFDSENPNGVEKHQKLQSFLKGSRKIKRHNTPKGILKFWGYSPSNSFFEEPCIKKDYHLFNAVADSLKAQIKKQEL